MGPDTTVDFMAKVIAATPAREDQDHAHLLVDQNPTVPNRQAALLGEGEDPGPAMAAMAQGLERAGADFLVMPCNTAHAYAPAIRAAVSIPFVSIIDVTVDACRGHDAVGVLATAGCIEARLYQEAMSAAGIAAVLPDDSEIAEISRIAVEIKRGERGADATKRMKTIADMLVARGATAIIAACTEIPLVLGHDSIDVPLISSTDVLAEVTASMCAGVA
jgi:aspartate racemase